jgi:hypothetical protein
MNNLPGYFTSVKNFIQDTNLLTSLQISDPITQFQGVGTLLKYYGLKNTDHLRTLVKEQVCKIEPTYIIYARITGKGLLGAHIDHGPLVSLNYYISAKEDETIFFEKKDQDIKGEAYLGRTEANIFDIRDLNTVGKFVSNTNEAYLLNVNKIHAVHKKIDETRAFIAFSWHHHTYQEIFDNLI